MKKLLEVIKRNESLICMSTLITAVSTMFIIATCMEPVDIGTRIQSVTMGIGAIIVGILLVVDVIVEEMKNKRD